MLRDGDHLTVHDRQGDDAVEGAGVPHPVLAAVGGLPERRAEDEAVRRIGEPYSPYRVGVAGEAQLGARRGQPGPGSAAVQCPNEGRARVHGARRGTKHEPLVRRDERHRAGCEMGRYRADPRQGGAGDPGLGL